MLDSLGEEQRPRTLRGRLYFEWHDIRGVACHEYKGSELYSYILTC